MTRCVADIPWMNAIGIVGVRIFQKSITQRDIWFTLSISIHPFQVAKQLVLIHFHSFYKKKTTSKNTSNWRPDFICRRGTRPIPIWKISIYFRVSVLPHTFQWETITRDMSKKLLLLMSYTRWHRHWLLATAPHACALGKYRFPVHHTGLVLKGVLGQILSRCKLLV